MVARLERVQNGFAVMLTTEMVEALHLTEGAEVEVLPISAPANDSRGQVRYATTEETLRAFHDTLPQHEAAYRELAK
jgi:hypothetical protein